MTRRNRSDLVLMAAVSAAAAGLLFGAGAASAAYTSSTTFQTNNADPNDGSYRMDDPLNWTNGLPDATKLAILGPAAAPPTVPTPMTAHSFRFASDFGFKLNGNPWTLTSTDSTADDTLMTSPALHYGSTGVGEFQINNTLILGDGSVSTGTAYVLNNGPARLIIGGSIGQAAGTTWGLTVLPATGSTTSDFYRFRGEPSSGNYMVNRYTFTGPLTLEAGAIVRTFNNLLPYGPGLPNTTFNGDFRHSQNSGTIMINALDGASTGILGRNGGNDIGVGANNGNANFAGRINNGSTRLYKVGTGTQVLSNDTNSVGSVALIGGTVSVNTIGDAGADSGLGRGNNGGSVTVNGGSVPIGGTAFDGGTLRYTGAGNVSNREATIGFRGGTIESSGTGALQLNGPITSHDLAIAFGDPAASGTTSTITNMYGVQGLGALADQLTIVDVSGFNSADFATGVYNTVGTSPASIDETARTMQLPAVGADGANPALAGVPGSGAGAPRFVFSSKTGLERTLTLSGTNAGANAIGGALGDSALGGKLNVAKSGSGTWVLTGANTYTGATTVNGGVLAMTAAGVPAASAITVNTGATWEGRGANSAITAHNITVNSGGTAALESTGTGTIVLRSNNYTLNGTAKLDLRDNKLITSKPAGHATAGVYAEGSVHREVQKSYLESSWTGPGITTSMDDAKSGLTTIAVLTGEQYGSNTFMGQSIAPTDSIAMYTYGGDTNLDGKLDADDYGTIDFNVLLPGVVDQYYNGDFNYDGVVNADDYGVIDFNILAQKDPFATNGTVTSSGASLAGVTAVPEPASLSVLGLAAAGLLGRRRRQN